MANDSGKTQTGQPNPNPSGGKQQVPNDGSQPGVLGDWTEEQNLGQPGNPDARIGRDEVEEAFGKKKGGGGGQSQAG